MMEYREVLQFYLDKSGMTPAELAYKIGSPRSTINAILRGRAKEPTLSKAKAIADALGVSLEEMAEMTYGDSDNA